MIKEFFNELFRKNEMPKKYYKSDTKLNTEIAEKIRTFDKNFSETFFNSWIDNVFIRYAFLINKDLEKVKAFEKIHLLNGVDANWIEDLKLFEYFKNVFVHKVDFLDYNHLENEDQMKVRLCVVGRDIIGNEEATLEEQRVYYYDIDLVRKNNIDIEYSNVISNCPNCGAPTDVGTFGICEHCKESISIYDNIWKIKSIKLAIY